MHLLPVADCEWSTIDIMRGSEQHTCMCELAAATHICSTLRAYFYHSIANALSLIQNASYPQYDGLSLWAGKNRSTMGSRCFFLFSLLGSELLYFASLNMFSWVYAYICVWECVRGCAHECLRVCVCVSACRLMLKNSTYFLPECCELSLCPLYTGVTNKVMFLVSLVVFALF